MLKMNHELTAKWHEPDKVQVGLKDVVVLRPDLRVADGYIQYSTDGGSTWTNLIAVAELKGGKGDPGAKGDTGATGPAGPQGPVGAPGKNGADGKPGATGADGVTPHIGGNGNWYIGSTDTGKPSRGATGAKGDAGATGPAGAPGKDGAKGDPGAPGAAGPAGAPGKDGAPGAQGAQGEKGDKGDPGTPGKTPIRGTDYWTAADKQEIVNSVIAALPDGTEVSY